MHAAQQYSNSLLSHWETGYLCQLHLRGNKASNA